MTAYNRFIDKVQIKAKAGDGGAGSVSFRREIYVPKGGPDGGDGGNGGNVVLQPSTELQTLLDLRLNPLYKAANGDPGSKKNQSGKKGADKIIKVPFGTMVFDQYNQLIADLTEATPFIAAKGGKGGKGNQHFATPTNRVPRYAQPGLPGQELELRLELRLIAEVGLIGLPNAGKSTLLAQLTHAKPKIGNYPFTTLYPNLGVLKYDDREIIIADIPGLIEGASEGAGLGHEFLRHIDRTHTLIHLVEIIPDHPEISFKNYQTICQEIANSPVDLTNKKMIVVLNKADLIPEEDTRLFQDYFRAQGIDDTLIISGASGIGISELSVSLSR